MSGNDWAVLYFVAFVAMPATDIACYCTFKIFTDKT